MSESELTEVGPARPPSALDRVLNDPSRLEKIDAEKLTQLWVHFCFMPGTVARIAWGVGAAKKQAMGSHFVTIA